MIFLATLGIYSCRISKDIRPAAAEFPMNYRSGPQADTARVASNPWRTFFSDPALNTLIGTALAHNNDLQIAVKNIEVSALVLQQARLGYIPSIGLQAVTTTGRPSDNSLNGFTLSRFLGTDHIEDYTLQSALSWEADIWGKIRSHKNAALAGLLETEASRRALQTRIVNEIAKGYYNLLMLDSQLNSARNNVALNDSTMAMVSLQYQAGLVTSLAVQQAEAQKMATTSLIPYLEHQIIIQENAISVLSGAMPGQIERTAKLDNAQVMPLISAGLPADLLKIRPDIRQAEYVLARLNAEVGYSKANLYPSFSITAQTGLNAFKASNWFNIPASLFGTLAGGITQPLLNQRKLRTDYERSRIMRDKAVIQFRQAILTAVGEVSDALAKLEKLQQQNLLADARRAKLKQATQNAQRLFQNGYANYLEVITAQSNVLQSELECSNIKKARLDAVVDLYRAVGGGWK